MKTETRIIKMSYDNFEQAVAQFLYQIGVIADNEDLIATDFGIDIDDEGMVEFDIEVAKDYSN